MDTKMMRALEADGEKLRALTGEDHGPGFVTLMGPDGQACDSCRHTFRDAGEEPCFSCSLGWCGGSDGTILMWEASDEH